MCFLPAVAGDDPWRTVQLRHRRVSHTHPTRFSLTLSLQSLQSLNRAAARTRHVMTSFSHLLVDDSSACQDSPLSGLAMFSRSGFCLSHFALCQNEAELSNDVFPSPPCGGAASRITEEEAEKPRSSGQCRDAALKALLFVRHQIFFYWTFYTSLYGFGLAVLKPRNVLFFGFHAQRHVGGGGGGLPVRFKN